MERTRTPKDDIRVTKGFSGVSQGVQELLEGALVLGNATKTNCLSMISRACQGTSKESRGAPRSSKDSQNSS